MRPWHLGNTTVRSPFRLRDGLVALSTSSLQGNLRGEEQERAFRRLLGEHGIVELGDDDTNSVLTDIVTMFEKHAWFLHATLDY